MRTKFGSPNSPERTKLQAGARANQRTQHACKSNSRVGGAPPDKNKNCPSTLNVVHYSRCLKDNKVAQEVNTWAKRNLPNQAVRNDTPSRFAAKQIFLGNLSVKAGDPDTRPNCLACSRST